MPDLSQEARTKFVASLSSPILITGAGGLVGSALVSLLRKQGFSNLTLVSSRSVDLRDTESTVRIFQEVKPVLVYHLAASVFGLGGNSKYRSDILVDNVRINTNVVDASIRSGVKKVVGMGSGCVYPDLQDGKPTNESQMWDGPPHFSEGPYAHSKRLMAAHLDAAREQHGLESAFVISGNLYGPGDNFNIEDGHVIPSLIAKFHNSLSTGEPVRPWGTGVAERDFTYSEDMAVALTVIAENLTGPVNTGSGNRHRIREIVEALQTLTGVSVEWDVSKPDGQLSRTYDLEKLFSAGFSPQFDLEQGLAKTYQWYAENYPEVRR
jgi:GDP-L-fucose synthase